jgi:hypothetical protein
MKSECLQVLAFEQAHFLLLAVLAHQRDCCGKRLKIRGSVGYPIPPFDVAVCTENLIRVDDVVESLKLAE